MIKSIITNIKELRKQCIPVTKEDSIKEIIEDLKNTLEPHKDHASGLAANQIGYNKKVAICRIPKPTKDKKIEYKEFTLINPKIIEKSNKVILRGEGCLSLPGITIDTDRYVFIVYENEDIHGKRETFMAQDFEALTIQHEIAHLNGKTIFDFKHRDINRRRIK